ncbi:MAG: hypothetical protein EAX95_07515 [Candidatus Thorarchaeota archaeon]|nr:hypothetical protein [Candidatus Thorarchaeota archaeon]
MAKKKKKPDITAFRERVLKKITTEAFEEGETDVAVVARMTRHVVETLDSLVAVGIFKSRSEATAALVEEAISSKESLFEDIRRQAASLSRQRQAAMREAQKSILGRI